MKRLAFAVVSLALAGCVTEPVKKEPETRKKTGPVDFRPRTLSGKVFRERNSQRSPLSDARFELVGDGKVLAKGSSKEDGSYSLSARMGTGMVYRLRVSASCGGNVVKDLPFRATTDKMEFDVRFECP